MADLYNRCANSACGRDLPHSAILVSARLRVCSDDCLHEWDRQCEALDDEADELAQPDRERLDYAPELDELHGECRTFPDIERREW